MKTYTVAELGPLGESDGTQHEIQAEWYDFHEVDNMFEFRVGGGPGELIFAIPSGRVAWIKVTENDLSVGLRGR